MPLGPFSGQGVAATVDVTTWLGDFVGTLVKAEVGLLVGTAALGTNSPVQPALRRGKTQRN